MTRMSATPTQHYAPFQTVVFATDLSVFSQNAGLYASFLAQRLDAPLLVSHAFFLSQPALEVEVVSSLKSLQRQDLEAFLARRAERLGGGGIQSVPVLVEGEPAEAIGGIAEKHSAPIVVLGTHGGSILTRGIIGSTAESILRTMRCAFPLSLQNRRRSSAFFMQPNCIPP